MSTKRNRKPMPRLRNGRIENPNRPRIHVQETGGGRARMKFLGRMKADPSDRIPEGGTKPVDKYRFRGYLTDSAALAYGLGGTEYGSFEEALEDFEIPCGTPGGTSKREDPPHLEGRIRSAMERCRLSAQLYSKLLREHESRGVAVHPHRITSPGTYAWGLKRMRGEKPVLHRLPGFPRQVLSDWMGAFTAGENRIGLMAPADVALSIEPLDFRGGHVASADLTLVRELELAERFQVCERDPRAVAAYLERLAHRIRRWVESPSPVSPFSVRDRRRLVRTLVWIESETDPVPYRTREDVHSPWRMHVGPLTTPEPVPFVLLAALRATLEGGTVPRIVRAQRLVTLGTVDGLKPITLLDGTVVGPDDDLPLALSIMRMHVAERGDLTESERRRLGTWAKLCANAMVSGNPVQVNRRELPDRKVRLKVWTPGGQGYRTRQTNVVEEPGPWYFPPIAAAVTAGQQFLLYLARALVEQHGGRILYEAIDALAVLASQEGGEIALMDGEAGS